MTKGEGLVGLLYAIKDILEASAIMIITGVAVLAFFWIIVQYLWKAKSGGADLKEYRGRILMGLLLLFVIFAIYSLIALTGAIFGVNSSPSGGLYLQ